MEYGPRIGRGKGPRGEKVRVEAEAAAAEAAAVEQDAAAFLFQRQRFLRRAEPALFRHFATWRHYARERIRLRGVALRDRGGAHLDLPPSERTVGVSRWREPLERAVERAVRESRVAPWPRPRPS